MPLRWGSLPDVYRFLLTPRWLGLALLMAVAATVMVGLGLWQLDRYHHRTEINTRIDDATNRPPSALHDVLAPPTGDGVGAAPAPEAAWSVVSVTGRYDEQHEILARLRTNGGTMGFEIITPLVLPDGTAILVDRGWLPAPEGAATVAPSVPAAPSGEVVVVGRVHAPESRATAPEPFDGRYAVRRVDPAMMSESIPYPLYGAYLTLQSQTPPADPAFVLIPPDHQNAAMNAGYVVQWWAFALLTLFGFGYLAYRHAHPAATDSDSAPRDDLEDNGERVSSQNHDGRRGTAP
jgi:cytochrome oxidase assembly protein ShyY1